MHRGPWVDIVGRGHRLLIPTRDGCCIRRGRRMRPFLELLVLLPLISDAYNVVVFIVVNEAALIDGIVTRARVPRVSRPYLSLPTRRAIIDRPCGQAAPCTWSLTTLSGHSQPGRLHDIQRPEDSRSHSDDIEVTTTGPARSHRSSLKPCKFSQDLQTRSRSRARVPLANYPDVMPSVYHSIAEANSGYGSAAGSFHLPINLRRRMYMCTW